MYLCNLRHMYPACINLWNLALVVFSLRLCGVCDVSMWFSYPWWSLFVAVMCRFNRRFASQADTRVSLIHFSAHMGSPCHISPYSHALEGQMHSDKLGRSWHEPCQSQAHTQRNALSQSTHPTGFARIMHTCAWWHSIVDRQDGVRGLYSGVGAVVIGAIPGHAIHFATYEAVKDKLGGSHTTSGQGNSDFRHAAAGSCISHVRALITSLSVPMRSWS